MKVFYLFKIKEVFKSLYEDKPYMLYNVFKEIYHLPVEEASYAVTLLDQLVYKNEKNRLDTNIFIRLHNSYQYSKRGEIHYINNFYKNEISRLIVKNRYIKVECESSNSSFFEIISDINNNYFVCDFEHNNYFFIDVISSKIKV